MKNTSKCSKLFLDALFFLCLDLLLVLLLRSLLPTLGSVSSSCSVEENSSSSSSSISTTSSSLTFLLRTSRLFGLENIFLDPDMLWDGKNIFLQILTWSGMIEIFFRSWHGRRWKKYSLDPDMVGDGRNIFRSWHGWEWYYANLFTEAAMSIAKDSRPWLWDTLLLQSFVSSVRSSYSHPDLLLIILSTQLYLSTTSTPTRQVELGGQ